MSESTNVPNVRGPTPPQEPSKGTPVDQDKFKKLMKVEESDETQKRKKRNLSKQQEGDEEEIQAKESTPTAGLFSSLLKSPSKGESIFSVTEPLSLPDTTKLTTTPTPPPAAPTPVSNFQTQNIQAQVNATSSQESGEFFFIPSQTHDYVTEFPPDVTPSYEDVTPSEDLENEEISQTSSYYTEEASTSSQNTSSTQETTSETSKKDKEAIKKIQKKQVRPKIHKKEESKEKELEIKESKTQEESPAAADRISQPLPTKKPLKPISALKPLSNLKAKDVQPKSTEVDSKEPNLADQNLSPVAKQPEIEKNAKLENAFQQPSKPEEKLPEQPSAPVLPQSSQLQEKLEGKAFLPGTSKFTDAEKKLSPSAEKEIEGIKSTGAIQGSSESESTDQQGDGSTSQEEQEIAPIEGIAAQPVLQSVESNPDVEMPTYSKLSPEVFDVFQRMVGLLTIQKYSGISTTTIEINNPESMFNSGKLVLEHYDTAPHAFNVEFQGSESQVNTFNENITDLLAAIQHAKLTYTVNIKRATLAPTYRVEAKEDLTKETKK